MPLHTQRILDVVPPFRMRLRAGGRVSVARPRAAGGIADGLSLVRRAGQLVGVAVVAHRVLSRRDRTDREREIERLVVSVGIPVVDAFQVDLGGIVRLPLQRVVELLARAIADVVVGTETVRCRDQVAATGADRAAAAIGQYLREIPPHRVVVVVLAAIANVDQVADFADARAPAIAEQETSGGIDVPPEVAVRLGEGAGYLAAGEVERTIQLHVDEASDAAIDQARFAGLVDLDVFDCRGRQILERKSTAYTAEDLTPVQRGGDVWQATDDHGSRLPLEIRRDLHAGDALHGVGDAVVRQLADVLGHDGIDHHARVLLDRLRAFQAAAQRGHGDRGQVDGILLRLLTLLVLVLLGLGSGRLARRVLCGSRRIAR